VRFIILLAQAVPISLYVSLETVKVAQCKVGGARGCMEVPV
jgi:magnesium-transporting ATPase (P-type)